MKRLVIGAATLAAVAWCVPGWAQQAPAASPPPGVIAPAAPVQSMNRMPAGGRATSERGATGSVTRAHHRRHAVQSARHSSAHSAPAGEGTAGTTDQLNRQGLSQTPGGGNPTTINRMSVGGRVTSGGPTQ